MAPLQDSSPKKVLVLCLALVFVSSVSICAYSTEVQAEKNELFFGRRRMLELQDEDEQPIIKKKSSATTATTTTLLSTKGKNQTKLAKATTSSSSKNQTKLIKTGSVAAKNQTKLLEFPSESTKKSNKTMLIKPVSDSSTLGEKNPTIKIPVKKLNSTSSKSSNSTKTSTFFSKKSSDLTTTSSSKNKTAKATTTTSKDSKTLLDKNLSNEPKSKSKTTTTSDTEKPSGTKPKSDKSPKQTLPRWIDQDDDDDLVSGFRDLPSKFQETLIPDLERISKTSKVYLNKANKEITRGFKPIVGNKYAPTIASFTSFAFLLIPLILVSLIFNKFKAYFSLQKILIFIQIYMSIYFSILCLSSLVTGLEPLRFFYATSQSTYVCLQVLQTLGYVLYLLLLLMYLILVFSTETGLATKLLGLGQTFVGFAIGLHYYMMVFHRAVLHQPPKTTWKVHAVYATCFLLICLLTRADRRKKAYLEGGAEGKLS
ncbi:uncharacterized protein LOC113777707 [Coffea eugenioides]|uniref:uncharacterized protein LOC113777707 n=1 Tax=Coffea eugenioides TaxID=49369 RepID=UPI000F609126|nr:uncharacterized protein LOC113777707 [Coffea eugenioides]